MNIHDVPLRRTVLRRECRLNLIFPFLIIALFVISAANSRVIGQIRAQRNNSQGGIVSRVNTPAKAIPTTTLLGGNVLKLNGINSYVWVYPNSSLNLQAPFSVELWAYMDDWSAGNPARTGILSKVEHGTGGYELGLDRGSVTKSVGFAVGNCGVAQRSRSDLPVGWHHFVGTFDGRYIKLYTDSNLSDTYDAGLNCVVSYSYNYELRFGRSALNDAYGNNYFNGRIDEARIYNKVLTHPEAVERFNNGAGLLLNEFEPGLIAGWHFDEPSGSIAGEYSGRNLTGTLLNNPIWMPRLIPADAIVALQTDNRTVNSARITWVTALPSDSTVEYGTSPDYGNTVNVSTPVNAHYVNLTGLLPFTSYRFRVKSRNQLGQIITSGDNSFTTMDLPPTNNQFYVSADGSSLGNGAFGSPWDLRTALNQPATVQPGATIWLRGGRYFAPPVEGGFVSNLNGTSKSPIKVKSLPGEWAVIDGNLFQAPIKNKTILVIQGSYTWFMDFEITNSDFAGRKLAIPGSNPPERRGNSVDDFSTGSKLINLIIHDTGQGIGAWQTGRDNEYYGNIIYNNGWDAPDRTHGHGVYTQNDIGYKDFTDNIIFNPFSATTRTGGTDASSVRNYTWRGNVFFNGSMAWLGPNIENLRVVENYTFNSGFKVGNEVNSTYRNADVYGNYFMSGVQLFEYSNGLTFQNNTVWNNYPNGKDLVISTNSSSLSSIYTIDNNTYYQAVREFPYWHFAIYGQGTRTGDYAFNRTQGTQVQTYAYTGRSWQDDLAFDASSTYIDDVPRGTKVFVRKNLYDPNKAIIIIYNWDVAENVNVNVGAILKPGDKYELRNVQDYFVDVIYGTHRGTNVSVPMIGRTRAKPIGYDETSGWYNDPLQPNTFPRFGVFVLRKKDRQLPNN